VRSAVDISGSQAVNGQQVRFLEQDPVPPSLRGREAQLKRTTEREAFVWVSGIRRRVPKDWLVAPSQPAQGSPSQSTLAAPRPSAPVRDSGPEAFVSCDRVSGAEHFEEGDDDPITEQVWNGLQEACLELGLSWGEAQQFIAEASGIPLMDLDPSQFTWGHFLQVIERLEQLEAAQGQPAAPPPPPPPLPPTAKREEVAKVIYPPPSQYLGVAAYNELVAIAANLGLDEEAMVARLGIPAECPGYLLDRPWVFAMVRGLAAIAAGQQPGPPDFSRAVLKFGYRSDGGSRLVVVGLDGTLLHGEAAAVANMAQQLRIRCDSSGGPERSSGIRL